MNLARFLVDRAIRSGGKRSVSGFPIAAKRLKRLVLSLAPRDSRRFRMALRADVAGADRGRACLGGNSLPATGICFIHDALYKEILSHCRHDVHALVRNITKIVVCAICAGDTSANLAAGARAGIKEADLQ